MDSRPTIQDSRVLAAINHVQRERFVRQEDLAQANADKPLPIGFGQTISQPYIVAAMSELLAVKSGEKILEIGTGCGYQTAILAELARDVYSIEIIPELAQLARERLSELGYSNIHLRLGDGFLGWPEASPFDAIIVTCAPFDIPPPLLEQLKENGILVIPIGKYPDQMLFKVEKKNGTLYRHPVYPVRFVPMTGMVDSGIT